MKTIFLAILIIIPLILSAKDMSFSIQSLNELEENEDYVLYLKNAEKVLASGKVNEEERLKILCKKSVVLAILGKSVEANKVLSSLESTVKTNSHYQSRIFEAKAKLKLIEADESAAYSLFNEALKKSNESDKEFYLSNLMEIASLEQGKKFDETIAKVIEFTKRHPEYRIKANKILATTFMDIGQLKKALPFTEVLTPKTNGVNSTGYFEILLIRGGILQRLGQDKESKVVFEQILKLKPHSKFNIRIQKMATIEVALLNSQYEKAYKQLEGLLLLTPVESSSHRDMLRHFYQVILEQYEKKLNMSEAYSTLLNLDLFVKDEDLLFVNSGVINLLKHIYNDHSEIVDLQRKHAELERELNKRGIFKIESRLSRFFWGNFYLQHNDLNNSKKIFEKLSQDYPNSLLGWAGLQNVTTKEGRFMEAISNYQKAKNLAGKDVWVSYLQTPLLKLYDHAILALSVRDVELLGNQIVQLVPEYENVVHSTLGHFYYDKGAIDLAEKEFQKAILAVKASGDAHQDEPDIMLGNIFFKKGNNQEAVKHYNKALKIHPNARYALLGLAKVFFSEKDEKKVLFYYGEAIKYSLEGLKRVSDSQEFEEGVYSKANIELGEYYEKKGDRKMAIRHYKNAMVYGYQGQKELAKNKINSLLGIN